MFSSILDSDTICAISTASGVGGISVVRVSGESATQLAGKLCPFLPESPESHRVYYGKICEFDSASSFDEVLVSYFAKGRSFTGDDTIEISCHGSRFISEKVVAELIKAGARLARKGEFTFRAFMNGRIDLVQAESVLSLIESQNEGTARLALKQLEGELSKVYLGIEDSLTWMLAHLEAAIDFSAEDIDVVNMNELNLRAQNIQSEVADLLQSYERGRMVRDGLKVTLTGLPNVGKSSLLNALLGKNRSIVTPQAGTTRDVVEDRLWIDGIEVSFVDTAGLRESDDLVEQIGIKKSYEETGSADLILYMLDCSRPVSEEELLPLERIDHNKVCFVINKIDEGGWLSDGASAKAAVLEQLLESGLQNWNDVLAGVDEDRYFAVSAFQGTNLNCIKEFIRRMIEQQSVEGQVALSQARHVELLSGMQDSIGKGRELLSKNESPEFAAFEFTSALKNCSELLGKEFDEQVLDRIFKEFCLGK